MRRTAHSGVGRDPDGAVRTPDAFAEAGADAGGAGSVLINETRNILITVIAATAVISGDISLGAMLAVQYVAGQLSSPVEQMMAFVYTHCRTCASRSTASGRCTPAPMRTRAAAGTLHGDDAEDSGPENSGAEESAPAGGGIRVSGVSFRYDTHAPELTLDGIDLDAGAGEGDGNSRGLGKREEHAGEADARLLPAGARGDICRRKAAGEDADGGLAGALRRGDAGGVIFSDTIARNIAVGDGDVDMERVRSAAATACLPRRVRGLAAARLRHQGGGATAPG